MRKHVLKKLMALSACCILSASLLAGCGGSSEKSGTSTKTESSMESSEKSESNVSSEAASETTSEETTGESNSGEMDLSALEQYMDKSYMGISDTSENSGVYLTFTNDDSQALFVLYDGDTKEYACYAGEITDETDEEGNTYFTVTNSDGSAFRFLASYDEEQDVYSLNLGEELGTASLGECKASEVLEALQSINDNATPITLE